MITKTYFVRNFIIHAFSYKDSIIAIEEDMNNKKENSPFNRNEINREKILKIWEDNDVFNKSQEINRGLNKGDFTFNLAPLFVGKSIEVKECIEDVVIRRRLMEGFFLPDVDS